MVRGRGLRVLGVCAVLLGVLVVPVAAAPGGNAENAAKCQHSGYLNHTRADGSAFKNAGQCTRYAAQGGTLVEIRTPSVSTRIGELDGGLCLVTITLLNSPEGVDVLVVISTSGGTATPILSAPNNTTATLGLRPGGSMLSGTAEIMDSNYDHTGVFLPITIDQTPCPA